jgi:acetate kinase
VLILVANLGSTSFKFKVLDSTKNFESVAKGGYERIGQSGGDFPTHAAVIDHIAASLPKLDAIGFKAVHGGPISGAVRVTPDVINTMQEFAAVAPAHNPPYIAAMNAFAKRLPDVPQVAAFETAFHQTIPLPRQLFGVPYEWYEQHGIRRYGFHGASHRYIALRTKELAPAASRVVSCHLGGSCSVSGIVDQQSAYNSFSMTAQTGVMHNNRVGDFDAFAITKLLAAGLSLDDLYATLGKKSGLLGLSGISNDLRDIETAATSGNARAKLAIDAFVEEIRRHIGAAAVACGGVDLLCFTGGIGENSSLIRSLVCNNLEFLGLQLDPALNDTRSAEVRISSTNSEAAIWIVPTNEELIVAKQTLQVLTQ